MPYTNYSTIEAEVKARLGNRKDIDTRLQKWINDAMTELILNPDFDFPALDTTATITAVTNATDLDLTAILGDQVWHILNVVNRTAEIEVAGTSWRWVDRHDPLTATTSGQKGDIQKYYRYANKIYWYPVPDRDQTIHMRVRRDPVVQTGASVLEIEREWDEPLILLSTIKGYEALEQHRKASDLRTLYNLALYGPGGRHTTRQVEGDDEEVAITVRSC